MNSEHEKLPQIYCPVSEAGEIAPHIRKLILKNLCNDLARQNLDKAINIGKEHLLSYRTFVLSYGLVEIWFIHPKAKQHRFNVTFINPEDATA